jgi:hypothetical protein
MSTLYEGAQIQIAGLLRPKKEIRASTESELAEAKARIGELEYVVKILSERPGDDWLIEDAKKLMAREPAADALPEST